MARFYNIIVVLPFVMLLFTHGYKVTALGCHRELTGKEGILMSEMDFTPFKPTVCVWNINVDSGFRIILDIEVFQLETECCSCVEDFLEFRDGLNSSSPLIGRYCGKNRPRRIFSSANQLQVRFHSSMKQSKSVNKFRGRYQIICGAVIHANQGIINSPGYPAFLQGQCLFTIIVSFGWIKLTFVNFEVGLPTIEECDNDFIEVNEVSLVEFEHDLKPHKLCGTLYSKYFHLTSGRKLSLLYKSTTPGNRFSAVFKTMTNATSKCGGMFTQDEGYLYSYHYPLQQPLNTKCEWKIQVAHHSNIQLQFLLFNFTCSENKVSIYDGWSETAVEIATICGSVIPTVIYSRQNRLLIRSTTGRNGHTGHFMLSYKRTDKKLCKSNEFTCISRECLDERDVCDGETDCLDGSDELINCPKPPQRKTLYPLWVIAIFLAIVIMGFWLWKTWKKSVQQAIRHEQQPAIRISTYEDDYDAPSQSGAPPSYSEAVLQTDDNPPTYEEVVQEDNSNQCTLMDRNNVRYINNNLPPYDGPPQLV